MAHVGCPGIEVSVRGSVDEPVVVVRGELDVATEEEFRDYIERCLERGAHTIVLDCQELSFLGAAGLSVFVMAADELDQRGGSLVIRGASRFVVRLLEITELTDRVEVEPRGRGR